MIYSYQPALSKKHTWKKRKLDDIKQVVVHHSAKTFNSGRRSKTLAEIDKITLSHKRRDWGGGANTPTIAYHFVIDRLGRIFRVNPLTDTTWHAREANNYSIGVLVLGNYEKQKPSIFTKRAIKNLSKYLEIFLSITPLDWTWHNAAQKAPTICCGKNLIPEIEKLQKFRISF